jgi:dTDP-L-rhamnose 4-epimerase
VTALRYHNVYGPRMPRDTPYAGVASVFRSAYEAGRAPRCSRTATRCETSSMSAMSRTRRLRALLVSEPVDGPVNVASGRPHTVLDLAQAGRAAFGPKAPDPAVTGQWRPGDVRHVFADPRRARLLFGFEAATDFADGVVEFAHAPLRASLANAS